MYISESSGHPTFWILQTLYELSESYCRNPLEMFK